MSAEKVEKNSLKHKILLMMSSVDPEDCQISCEVLKKVLLELQENEEMMAKAKSLVEALVAKVGRCIVIFLFNTVELKEILKANVYWARVLKTILVIKPLNAIDFV